jgi:glycosyltransferase involved in cell wall biosynthesis
VQDPRPLRIDPATCQIVRYHDLIPLVRPDTMRNPWYIKWHHRAITQRSKRMVFVCNSEPTRDDLTTAYPELLESSTTIPNMLPATYYPDPCPDAVERILDRRRSAATSGAAPAIGPRPRYLLSVSTLEPRKNFTGLIQAFNMLKWRPGTDGALGQLKLVIVGSPGWKYEPILDAMRNLIERGELVHLEKVPSEEMRVLYTHAEAFVFPSNYEGFGFPPLEAMQCGTPVIASDIATHRWVLGDAALYCSPYDTASIASAIERLVASDEASSLRGQCVSRGYLRVQRYHVDRCADQWRELLHRLQENPSLRGSFHRVHPAEARLPSAPTRVPAELPR